MTEAVRLLLITLCSLFAIGILWSVIGRVDVVAVATGKTLPAAKVKLIQPMEIGVVRAIHVRNGQRVRKGQLLVELDPTMAGADQAQATQGLNSSRVDEARNDALLAYLQGRAPVFIAPPGTDPGVAATQREMIRSSIAEYEAERAGLVETRAQKSAELSGAMAEVAKLRETLPLVDQQLAARRLLTQQGNFPKLRLLEYEQARLEHVRNIDIQLGSVGQARAAIANLEAQLRALKAGFAKKAATDLATASTELSVRSEEYRKSERRRVMQQLRAPVDGIVQQLAIHTVGGVVQPAQPLMVIVPSGSEVEVEAQVLNRDIGFVHEGQKVRVKLEAYPFTDYGYIDGIVENISRDAVEPEAPPPGSGREKQPSQGLVYSARIRLLRDYVAVGGRRQPIGPGLAVQAEIKTGKRRIIQYVLSPISKAMDEAGRER